MRIASSSTLCIAMLAGAATIAACGHRTVIRRPQEVVVQPAPSREVVVKEPAREVVVSP
jgi:hypothetical protein